MGMKAGDTFNVGGESIKVLYVSPSVKKINWNKVKFESGSGAIISSNGLDKIIGKDDLSDSEEKENETGKSL